MLNLFKRKYDQFAYKKIVAESLVVSVTEYLMLGSFILVNFLINHYYGTEVVGVYAVSYAIAQIGIMGIGSVFSLLMRRDLSVGAFDADSYVSRVTILRSWNLLLVLFLSSATILLFYPPLRANLLLILFMVCAKGLDALSETYYTAYQTLGRLKEYSVLKTLNAATFIAVSTFVCVGQYNIFYLYAAPLVGSLVIFIVNLSRWRGTRVKASEKDSLEIPGYRFLLIESYPLMVAAMIFQMGLRANNVLIFDQLGEKEVGMFSLVVITIGIFAGVANALAIVFFGRLSRMFVDQPGSFLKRLHQTVGLFVGLGFLFLLTYLTILPFVIRALGVELDAGLYSVMAAAIPFMFVVSCLGAIFTIIKRQKIGMYITIVTLVLSLSAYYFLVGQYGLMGAGYAFLITAILQSAIIYVGALLVLRSIFRAELSEGSVGTVS